jgi:hypothetical protein
MNLLRRALIRLFAWAARRLSDVSILLRLFSLVLEREAARCGPAVDEQVQRRIDDGQCNPNHARDTFVLRGGGRWHSS